MGNNCIPMHYALTTLVADSVQMKGNCVRLVLLMSPCKLFRDHFCILRTITLSVVRWVYYKYSTVTVKCWNTFAVPKKLQVFTNYSKTKVYPSFTFVRIQQHCACYILFCTNRVVCMKRFANPSSVHFQTFISTYMHQNNLRSLIITKFSKKAKHRLEFYTRSHFTITQLHWTIKSFKLCKNINWLLDILSIYYILSAFC